MSGQPPQVTELKVTEPYGKAERLKHIFLKPFSAKRLRGERDQRSQPTREKEVGEATRKRAAKVAEKKSSSPKERRQKTQGKGKRVNRKNSNPSKSKELKENHSPLTCHHSNIFFHKFQYLFPFFHLCDVFFLFLCVIILSQSHSIP